MPTPDSVAADVMDSAAALLNDSQKQTYTYAVQIPYLKIAMRELRELLELSNIPVTNETSTFITVPTGVTVIGFNTAPALPSNLAEIQRMWERPTGSDNWIPMTKRELLPKYLEGVPISQFLVWEWSGNQIKLLASNQYNDLKIDYIAQLFNLSTLSQNTVIGVINAESFLSYRTAGLCAEFVEENKPKADDLNNNAGLALDRVAGIENKAKQAIATRHRPFRAAWKSRGIW